MSDEPDNKLPLALRLSFTPVLAALVFLLGVRWLNSASVYPYALLGEFDARSLAEARDDARSIEFKTADGLTLYGWVQGRDDARHKIIQFQGNAEQVGRSAELYAATCERLDAQFLIFNYRGCAPSQGSPSEPGLYTDARAAWKFATTELRWQPARTALWGRSLGGGPATRLAAELVDAGTPPAALILEAPFTSIAEMATVAMPHLIKPEWLIYNGFDNLARAPKLALPVFHFHGDRDDIIPFAQGERLHAALPGPKRFLRLDGVEHNDIWSDPARADDIRRNLAEFLEEHA